MSTTNYLNLNKHDNITTNQNAFDIENYLNGNWDKIDQNASSQSANLELLQSENTRLKKNQIYGTLTGTEVEITDSAEMGASIGVSGNSTQDEEPSPSNPSEIKNLTGDTVCKVRKRNLAYTDWAEDFVSRIDESSYAKLETKDGRNCLYYKARAGSGDYDNKYMFKTDWKENTQYTIVCDIYSDAISGNIGLGYTDGTSSYIENLSTNKWTKLVLTSSANKTLKYVRAVWQSDYTYIDLDTFMILEGSYTADTLPDYVPYQEKSVTFPLGEQKLCRKSNTEYDYLSDNGIVNVLEQTDNTGTKTIEESFSLRETPLVAPYTQAQQTAYNNLKNLILFEGYNHIEMISPNGVKANLTVNYTKSTQMVINDIEERLSALENAILEV